MLAIFWVADPTMLDSPLKLDPLDWMADLSD